MNNNDYTAYNDMENKMDDAGAPVEAEAAESVSEEVRETSEKTEIMREVVDELGVISEDTRIEGDIETKGHLVIDGNVEGNVSAKGNIIVRGNVRGKIVCDNLVLEQCTLVTEIEASGQVSIKEGNITGRITCRDLSVNGTVNGDITARDTLALSGIAVVNGDIRAARIGMEFGAVVNGQVSMSRTV